MHQNAGNMSQNFLGKLNTLYIVYSKRAGKIINFYLIIKAILTYDQVIVRIAKIDHKSWQ